MSFITDHFASRLRTASELQYDVCGGQEGVLLLLCRVSEVFRNSEHQQTLKIVTLQLLMFFFLAYLKCC